MERNISVKIKRFDSIEKTSSVEQYVVPLRDGMSILNVLNWIAENQDPSLAFYSSCRTGKCKGCLLRANGKVKMSCTELVAGDLYLEPMDEQTVIKDLVCSRSVDKNEPSKDC